MKEKEESMDRAEVCEYFNIITHFNLHPDNCKYVEIVKLFALRKKNETRIKNEQ